MGTWPDTDDLRVALGLEPGATPGLEVTFQQAVTAARDQVITDTGAEILEDEVPEALFFAARYLAVQAIRSVDAPFGIAGMVDIGALYVARDNPIYVRFLRGYRHQFGTG
jgi:hypothetical protein